MSRGDKFRPSKRFSTERFADDGLPIYSRDELEEHQDTYIDEVVLKGTEGIKLTELKPCYVEYPKTGRFYEHKIGVSFEKEFSDIDEQFFDIKAAPVSKLRPVENEGLGILEADVRSPQEVVGYLIELNLVTGDSIQTFSVITSQTNPASIKQILLSIGQAFIASSGTLKEAWNESLQPLRGEITYRKDFSTDDPE